MRGNGTDSPQNGGYRSVISRGLPTRWTTVTTTFGELGRDGKNKTKKNSILYIAPTLIYTVSSLFPNST